MGEPIRIYDLAIKMIQLSGLVVREKDNAEGDIEIQYTGLKPGEKLYEELLVDGSFITTDNQLIMRAEEEMINWDKLEPILDQIKEAAIDSETDKMFELIKQLVPQFNHS
jgi:FlaA1/EpsC-like NDP-sugar epimerase